MSAARKTAAPSEPLTTVSILPGALLRCVASMNSDELRLLRDLLAGSSNVVRNPQDYGDAAGLIGLHPKPPALASAYPQNPTG